MGKYIIANWKMQKTNREAEEFFVEYEKLITENPNTVVFCVPYTTIPTAVKYSSALGFSVGAENVAWAESGTFTGEISAGMLIEANVEYVIVGHSERRAFFGETLETINGRLKMALASGLKAVLCVNETLEEFEGNTTNESIRKQLDVCLKDIDDVSGLIIAYEPVFAISGGDPNKPSPIPTQEKIEGVHSLIREIMQEKFAGSNVPVLYGGSANDGNAPELFQMNNVDGALVGGASLDPAKFSAMCNIGAA